MWQCLRRTIRRNLYLQEDLIEVSYFRGQTRGLTWRETFCLIFGAQLYVLTCLKLFCTVPRALFYSQGFVGKTTLGRNLKAGIRQKLPVISPRLLIPRSISQKAKQARFKYNIPRSRKGRYFILKRNKWLENRGLSNPGWNDRLPRRMPHYISVANSFEFVTVSIATADQL